MIHAFISIHSPFSHILFFFFLMLPLCLAGLDYSSIRSDPPIHQGPYTKLLGFKCPYTCLFLYRKKLQMSTFLVYLYKKKPLRALKHPYTSIHPYTKFCAQILKFCATCATCAILRSLDHYFLSMFHWLHAAGYYLACSACCAILLIVLSALRYLTHCAQRTALSYSLCTAHCGGLPLEHSALWGITSWAQRTVGDYLLGTAQRVGLPLVCLLMSLLRKQQIKIAEMIIWKKIFNASGTYFSSQKPGFVLNKATDLKGFYSLN